MLFFIMFVHKEVFDSNGNKAHVTGKNKRIVRNHNTMHRKINKKREKKIKKVYFRLKKNNKIKNEVMHMCFDSMYNHGLPSYSSELLNHKDFFY